MKRMCPNPDCLSNDTVSAGFYLRKCDSHLVKRYCCKDCKHKFSDATGTLEFGQHKRRENPIIQRLLGAVVSMNEISRIVRVNRKTVDRKLVYLSKKCLLENEDILSKRHKVDSVQFDEMETVEHTKCKPVAVALAVETKTRAVLGFTVSRMPAKGPLATIARKKYGKRVNERVKGLRALMESIVPRLANQVTLLSDMCPFYARAVDHALGKNRGLAISYRQVKGRKGCVSGQEELKKTGRDPLFSLNHTCAMFRAHVSRLIRHTWNTTKKLDNLVHHLNIYVCIHNRRMLGSALAG